MSVFLSNSVGHSEKKACLAAVAGEFLPLSSQSPSTPHFSLNQSTARFVLSFVVRWVVVGVGVQWEAWAPASTFIVIYSVFVRYRQPSQCTAYLRIVALHFFSSDIFISSVFIMAFWGKFLRFRPDPAMPATWFLHLVKVTSIMMELFGD